MTLKLSFKQLQNIFVRDEDVPDVPLSGLCVALSLSLLEKSMSYSMYWHYLDLQKTSSKRKVTLLIINFCFVSFFCFVSVRVVLWQCLHACAGTCNELRQRLGRGKAPSPAQLKTPALEAQPGPGGGKDPGCVPWLESEFHMGCADRFTATTG